MENLPTVVIPADEPPLVARSTHLNDLRRITNVRLFTDRPASDAEMLERLATADVLLNSRSAVKVSGTLLRQLPNLKMIAVCGIGYDSIDIQAATERNIVVSNIPGRTAGIVAEHAMALMFSVARRIPQMTRELRQHHWSSELGVSLTGKRLGVIGTGNIGCEMMRLCRSVGMDVVAWTFQPDQKKSSSIGFRYVAMKELLTTSDVISLHVRLSPQTVNMIGASEIARMKPGTILINTARAAVVDTNALATALLSGHLWGAGIDVFDAEPILPDNPLLNCTNVALTPHSADQTPEGIDLLTAGCVANIRAFLEGHPTNVVNATDMSFRRNNRQGS
ncbi:MAG: hypothetical protein KDA81_00940 [Planctomycetaceae bacterium]|nr:hypothetical protein [Planctomycetaceae bacterium]